MSSHSEFSVIQQYFEQLTPQRDDVVLGIGDDCALLDCPDDHSLAVSIDTLVEGIHFFADVDAESLGHKSLAVGLSDLAAMGAKPAWFTLALSLPQIDHDWLKSFSHGLARLANQHNIQLVGGDTTRGPLTISIQVHGFVKTQQALRRDGAQVGDYIYVTGSLGDAGAALQLKLKQLDESVSLADQQYLQQRLEKPIPRIEFGQQIQGLVTAAIDISDGLIADLGHILTKSQVGASIDLAQIPLSPVLTNFDQNTAQQLALSSGDDYELCFTVSPNKMAQLEQYLTGQCQRIGIINADVGVLSAEVQGQQVELKGKGYDHFSTTD